ncbi:hypothetical protein BTM25_00780 [Actinomadura rubteroloni]|uniref:DUF2142 domain-containing protein n=1 Tax=Actinomadura rubteroloni TaxID=1926885 RepID=A0A2P4UKW5_9ACTN|nr:hypothetical protein [Actinomadura rubteroloni]POM25695.1 hypothetical protein BTM25_00780 [Actinomadura rubteroloni]
MVNNLRIGLGMPFARPVPGDRRWLRTGLFVAAALVLGATLWLVRWSAGPSTATPDTFWYARDAFRFAGVSEPRAELDAARITCSAMAQATPRPTSHYRRGSTCVDYRSSLPQRAPQRFEDIFTSRPGYALLTAPFVWTFGPRGFALGTAFLGVACGAAAVGLALAAGLRPAQALLAELVFYLLPSGLWTTRMLAEAPMILCVLLALTGAVLLLREVSRVRAGALLAAGLACCCVVKPANGVALSAALLAGAVPLFFFARSRPACLAVAGIAGLVLAGNGLVSSLLHLPGTAETLQDTFTRHYRHPDVPDVWPRLRDLAGELWNDRILPQMHDDPLIPAGYLLGAAGLFTRLRGDVAWPLLLAGLTGAVVVTMHPLGSETDRLATVTWVPVALGLAALTAPSRFRRPSGAEPPVPAPAPAPAREGAAP